MPFRDIPGHRRLLDLLGRSIQRGTLPPSLIFAGPPETGKRATAVAVAQALNCLHPVEPAPGQTDACGKCSACTRVARAVHPDVLVVEPDERGSIRMEHVREIVDRAAYRPFEAKRRVVIVDEADALVVPAQHALLKTLEEPPSSSVFILVTARPDTLLATVRSRCIRLAFGDRDVPRDDDSGAREVAQRVLAHGAATSEPARRLDGAKELLAKIGGARSGDRDLLGSYLRAMASLLRDAQAVAAGADSALANPEARSAVERLAVAYRGERGVRAFTAIDRALEALKANAGFKVLADWVVLQL
jgi:DNA polymerase III subunit delta'